MTVTFRNFEHEIDPTILERGWQYYQSGKVRGLEKDDEGLWFAYVSGTMKYEVQIEESPDGELFCECTCPYEWGPECKHVAAVLYAIKAQADDTAATKPRSRSKSPKQKTSDKLRATLEKLSQGELVALLLEQLEKDEAFASLILNRYSDEVQCKSVYARRVREALKAGRGEYGYIDYWGATRAAKNIQPMLSEADTLIGQGQASKAAPMLQAMIEVLVPGILDIDDSNGDLGGCIDEAFEYLHRVAEVLPTHEKHTLFDYCLSQAVSEKFEDSSWDLLHVAAKLVSTAQEREALFKLLDQKVGSSRGGHFYHGYGEEEAARIRLTVIQRQDGQDKAHQFLLEHSHLEGIRQELVEHYVEQGNLAAAKKLCKQAIGEIGRGRAGWYHPYLGIYQQYLLDIAQRENDNGEVVRLAQELFVSSGRFEYYDDLLKRAVPQTEWPAFVERLIETLQKLRAPLGLEEILLAEIYRREAMWERLLALVKERGLRLLERYRTHLEERYPKDVAALYDRGIYSILQRGSSRKDYQRACDYLRRMKQLGKQERVKEIIGDLKAQYPKRRALLEELANV